MLSVTDARRHILAVATAGDVRGDPEVLAKGRHLERRSDASSNGRVSGGFRGLKEGRSSSIESEPFPKT